MLDQATLVAADFVKTGGMDRANYAVADYLTRRGTDVILVSHRVSTDLAGRSNARWQRVPRPFGLDVVGEIALDHAGKRARSIARGPVLVNGGNCIIPAV